MSSSFNASSPLFRARYDNTLAEDLLSWLVVVPLCSESKVRFQEKLKDHAMSRGSKLSDLFASYFEDPTNQYIKDRIQERIREALIYLNTTEEFHLI